jgi:hypothetical protein
MVFAMEKLEEFHYFHDWYIDAIAVRDRHKLILSMTYDGRSAKLIFNGTSRCTIDHFSVSNNIVFEVKTVKPGDANYDLALSMLGRSEYFSKIPGRNISMIVATAGAEMAIEFDSLDIESA